ncbi:hypothetical protein DNTS_012100 [Danionella cerebrum]|uniref:t-SNARE coiled-coil homology domain-containing protein n=1 Tax=Danionella cerebrum TaxID=2873325 RepID=A0A553RMR2_9TELE|nr:hypothetical protein DNTS_012100 [Danionella translucida]
MDSQTELLKKVDAKIEANTVRIQENRQNIEKLQQKVDELQVENKSLREGMADLARYKQRWNLRLNGLPEKEGEDTRELIIGILTRVVPLSVERLRETVDTVHRLGKRGSAATSNNTPRSIIAQFVSRVVRDDVWKRSRDARRSTSTLRKTSPERTELRAQSYGHLFKTHGEKAKGLS